MSSWVALESVGCYNKLLLFIPGAFLFPRALLRNRRTSRVRSGASLCPRMPGDVAGSAVPCANPGRAPFPCAPSCNSATEARALRSGAGALTMDAITQVLNTIEQGDPHAAEQLLPLVYDELRQLAAAKLAQEKPGQTLQATALVHEAYLRLVDTEKIQE